jgi:patatin-like phospholipase/acyl hydrolase
MTSHRFQVLALDGGGIRGIFAAALLAGLEEDLGRPIVEMFDLVVGTSTGGIIALGLGAGLSPAQIVDFYVTQQDTIFGNNIWWGKARQLFVAKYRPGPFEAALRDIFGDRLLGESRVPLVVPSYNLGENDASLLAGLPSPRQPRSSRRRRRVGEQPGNGRGD